MSEAYRLLVTTRRERLSTVEHPIRAWEEWERLLAAHAAEPTRYELSDSSGAALVHWMLDAERSHLSLWDGNTCYYLESGDPSTAHHASSRELLEGRADVIALGEARLESGVVELGWSVYPAWSVSEDLELAREAVRLYWLERELSPRARWLRESLEL